MSNIFTGCLKNNVQPKDVMLNPESVILNLIQNLFRAGLFQHLIKSTGFETLKSLDPDPETSSG